MQKSCFKTYNYNDGSFSNCHKDKSFHNALVETNYHKDKLFHDELVETNHHKDKSFHNELVETNYHNDKSFHSELVETNHILILTKHRRINDIFSRVDAECTCSLS